MIVDFSTYSLANSMASVNFAEKVKSKKSVYATIVSGIYAGSVGRVTKILNNGVDHYGTYQCHLVDVLMEFDNRPNPLKQRLVNLSWDPTQYEGPTNCQRIVSQKKTMAKKPLYDKFGSDLTVGCTILFARYSSKKRHGPEVCIGKITKITDATNTVYCEPFSFDSGDHKTVLRITDNSSLIKVDETLQDRILLAKLSE